MPVSFVECKSHLSKTVKNKGMRKKEKKDPLSGLSFEHFYFFKLKNYF